jgi:hypothetical protein
MAAILFGIDVGWQRSPDGDLEYIIQIEPEMLDTLREGRPIHSDIPPQLKDVRSYRIQVGTGKLPREGAEPSGADRTTTKETMAKERPDRSAAEPFAPLITPGTPADSVRAPTPRELPSDPESRPIAEQPASFAQPIASAPGFKQARVDTKGTSAASPEQPWLPMLIAVGTAVALFAAFVYLLWIHLEVRSRYRALLAERIAQPRMGNGV